LGPADQKTAAGHEVSPIVPNIVHSGNIFSVVKSLKGKSGYIMIEIGVTVTGDRVRKVEVTGHGGGKAGSDIVCAAVSAVAETALAGLLHYDREGVNWEMREGYISIQVRDSVKKPTDAIMTTMIIGLKQIVQEYPERVSLRLVQDTGITDEA